MTDVKLIPFYKSSESQIQIQIQYELINGFLQLKFKIQDVQNSINDLQIDNTVDRDLSDKDRKDELWKQTCFEFFVKKADHKNYYEFNASPKGQWNFYRFSDYRSPIDKENTINCIKMSSEQQGTWKILTYHLDLNPLFKKEDSLLFSFSAVIKQGSEVSYWAHKHSAEKPDFHHVNNFTIEAKFK